MNILPRTFNAELIQRDYSRVAWTYNFWSRLTESKAAEKALEMAEIQDGENILEVAVGTGIMFEEMVKRNQSGKTVGIDLSSGMLGRAVRRLAKHNSNHFYFNCANAFYLPFKEKQFDLVVNNYMFDLLPEEKFEAILVEFKRVLKNPGRIVITNMAYGKYWFHKFWAWLAKASPSFLTGCRPVSLEGYLKKTGFSNIQVVSVSQNTFPSEVLKAEI